MALPSGEFFKFIAENVAAAMLLMLYLHYQLHYGVLAEYQRRVDALTGAVLAIASDEGVEIDVESVRDAINGQYDSSRFEDVKRRVKERER